MTSELLLWLLPAAATVFGFWLRHWTGPVATFLRRFLPAPGSAPVMDPSKLIPDDPNSLWDDVARALLSAALQGKSPEPEKLSLIERLLEALKSRLGPQPQA